MADAGRKGRAARAAEWLDERTGHRKLLTRLLDSPVVGGARWAYVFGSALTLTLVVQAVTGLLLMTAYAPSAQTSWASVYYLGYVLPGGWVIRGLHHFGSQATVVLLGAHLLQVAAFGAYRRPREVTWFSGLALLAVTLGFGVTGDLLPMDQKGYWATLVHTGIAGSTPVVGAQVQRLMQGGAEVGHLTVTRFYTLHVAVLPLSVLLVLVAHVALFRKHGVTPPANAPARNDRFFPRQAARDLAAGLVVLLVLFALTWQGHGVPLDAPADPASEYSARPEWYFRWLFQLRKYFPGSLEVIATLGLPLLVGGYLAALPFLDKKPTNALRPRLGVLAPLGLLLAGAGLLTALSFREDARDRKLQAARTESDERARVARHLASRGIPPGGPLEMMRNDPDLRGEAIFRGKCAACHVLERLGDREKAKAPVLDGWSTEPWILGMLHDPDAPTRMGRTPFAGQMPSMDMPPAAETPGAASFKAMTPEDMRAVAAFLASQSDEPGEAVPTAAARREPAVVAAGEKIVRDRCTTCHLFGGEGDDTGQELAPELKGYGSLAWVTSQVRNPATKATYREKALDPSLKGHMPRFDDDLSAADIDVVARWVRARARASSAP